MQGRIPLATVHLLPSSIFTLASHNGFNIKKGGTEMFARQNCNSNSNSNSKRDTSSLQPPHSRTKLCNANTALGAVARFLYAESL
eukprot:scaffold212333_cov21-Tisochrysis_lutea.AAC.1